MSAFCDIAFGIRITRQAIGMSQYELARLTGMPRQNISRLENRRIVPTIETTERIAQALNIPLIHLITLATAKQERKA